MGALLEALGVDVDEELSSLAEEGDADDSAPASAEEEQGQGQSGQTRRVKPGSAVPKQ